MTPDALIAAFALPPGPPPRRVPKASLADHAPTAADRKLIDKVLARLDWIAGINPASSGVPAGEAEGLAIDTINLLSATTRGSMSARLAEIIHRAIPKPVILVHAPEEGGDAALSLAPKRAAEREAGRVVTIAVHDSGPMVGDEVDFAATLALAALPARDLAALYAGLIERIEALHAARLAARPFRLAASQEEAGAWRAALAREAELAAAHAAQISAAKKETRLARRVELGETAARIKQAIDQNRAALR